MKFQHKEGERHSSFMLEQNGKMLAEIVYKNREDGMIVIEHTEVDESLKGKNVGYELVETVVNMARQENRKIIPLCSFAKSVIDKQPAFQDVLA